MMINSHSPLQITEKIEKMREQYKLNSTPTILAESLNFLLLTLGIHKPKKILEIGTATGMSGICMLLEVENSHLTTIEKDEESYIEAEINFRNFGLINQVKQFLGDAGDILNYLDATFDLIFLDGSKARYYNYMHDLLRLLNKGGVLIADNVLFRGFVDGTKKHGHGDNTIVRNMRAFINEMTLNSALITQVLNIGDGILISYKKS